MARPLRIHIPNAFYHVISRGNAKQSIFVGEADYERFLELLDATSSRFGVRCRAYCLMPNHFHLIRLHTPRNRGLSWVPRVDRVETDPSA